MSIPAFKCVVFKSGSTHCDSRKARASVTDDGNAISVLFDKMKVEGGAKKRGHDRARCELIFKLVSPLEATAEVQFDVRGAVVKIGKGSASAAIEIRGHRQSLVLDSDNPEANMFITILPKGAKRLNVSLVASAKGKHPESSAMVAIDSIEAIIRSTSVK